MPCVLKRLNLRVRLVALGAGEKYIVGGGAVKGRIKIDEVYRFVPNGFTEHVEVVAKK